MKASRWVIAVGVLVGLAGLGYAQERSGKSIQIGIGVTVINPFLDVPLAGYYYPRMPAGIHDDLHAKALVLDNGRDQVVLVACDLVHVSRGAVEDARIRIQKAFGIPPDHVLISATHTHTGPQVIPPYTNTLGHRIADSVETAEHKKQSAHLFVALEQEPSLPRNRRYFMKNGSVVTNPGFLNPDIVKPAGPIDPWVSVLVATGEQNRPIMTWVNYAMHQDTIGGDWISADYSYYLARTLALFRGPDMTTIFTIGAAGDINHWDLTRPGPQRGFGTAQRIGEVLGADVIKAYTNLQPINSNRLRALSTTLEIPIEKITPQQVAQARKILAVPPPPNVDFTLDRVEARKIMEVYARKGRDIQAEVQVLSIGPVAFVGVPGELFVQLGMQIVKNSPFPYTFIVELANQDIGYIPTRKAFREGGYEPTSSAAAPGDGELIVKAALELLNRCRE